MNFPEIIRRFEEELSPQYAFEVLELQHLPHAFGSGFKAYRIGDRNIIVVFDGRDDLITVQMSGKHEKYRKNSQLEKIFTGSVSVFFASGIKVIRRIVSEDQNLG